MSWLFSSTSSTTLTPEQLQETNWAPVKCVPTIKLEYPNATLMWNDFIRTHRFDKIIPFGVLNVNYRDEFMPYVIVNFATRHQAVALCAFIESGNSVAYVSCPHDNGGYFTAKFEYFLENDGKMVRYSTACGKVVKFSFSSSEPSQFKDLTPFVVYDPTPVASAQPPLNDTESDDEPLPVTGNSVLGRASLSVNDTAPQAAENTMTPLTE